MSLSAPQNKSSNWLFIILLVFSFLLIAGFGIYSFVTSPGFKRGFVQGFNKSMIDATAKECIANLPNQPASYSGVYCHCISPRMIGHFDVKSPKQAFNLITDVPRFEREIDRYLDSPKGKQDVAQCIEMASSPDAESKLASLKSIKSTSEIYANQKGLEADQLLGVIQPNLPKFQKCFKSRKGKSSYADGKVKVKFKINPKGKVYSTKVVDASIKSKRVHTCLRKKLRRLKFPKPTNGRTVTAMYPFEYSVH